MRLPISLLIICFALTDASAAEVYRSVDADGNVVYSDRPPSDDAEIVTITVDQTANPQPLAVVPQSSDTQSAAEPPEELAQAVSEEFSAQERARNCEIAQERNARYEIARRLYREGPDGEREWLSDDEIDAAKARAAAEVTQWCS